MGTWSGAGASSSSPSGVPIGRPLERKPTRTARKLADAPRDMWLVPMQRARSLPTVRSQSSEHSGPVQDSGEDRVAGGVVCGAGGAGEAAGRRTFPNVRGHGRKRRTVTQRSAAEGQGGVQVPVAPSTHRWRSASRPVATHRRPPARGHGRLTRSVILPHVRARNLARREGWAGARKSQLAASHRVEEKRTTHARHGPRRDRPQPCLVSVLAAERLVVLRAVVDLDHTPKVPLLGGPGVGPRAVVDPSITSEVWRPGAVCLRVRRGRGVTAWHVCSSSRTGCR